MTFIISSKVMSTILGPFVSLGFVYLLVKAYEDFALSFLELSSNP